MEHELKSLGLKENEIKVYLTVLRLRGNSVTRISELAGIPRPTTYDTLHTLIEKGLISTYKKDKKSYFSAVAPEELLSQLKEKESIAKKILPELKKLIGTIEKRPSVEVYEGKKGVVSMLNEVYKEKELLIYGSAKRSQEILGHLPENFARRRVELKIRVRAILEESKEAFLRVNDPQLKKVTSVRFVDWMKNLPTVTFIYGENIAILSMEKELVGITIQDENVNKTQRILFENLWKQAKS
ncbi:MAG: helix-turn-helix domain-containing protein [Nanoarchaeota archaeon]